MRLFWLATLIFLLVVGAALLLMYVGQVGLFGSTWIQIVDGEGEPIWRATVVLLRPGADDLDYSEQTHRGDGWLEIPREDMKEGAEMFVIAPGCRELRRKPPGKGEQVVLPRGIPVTVRVPGEFPLPEPPLHLELFLQAAGADRPGGDRMDRALAAAVVPPDYLSGDRDWFDPAHLLVDKKTRSLSLLVPRAGRWRIDWMIVHHRVGKSQTFFIGHGPDEGDVFVTIPEDGATVDVAIDADEFKRYADEASDR